MASSRKVVRNPWSFPADERTVLIFNCPRVLDGQVRKWVGACGPIESWSLKYASSSGRAFIQVVFAKREDAMSAVKQLDQKRIAEPHPPERQWTINLQLKHGGACLRSPLPRSSSDIKSRPTKDDPKNKSKQDAATRTSEAVVSIQTDNPFACLEEEVKIESEVSGRESVDTESTPIVAVSTPVPIPTRKDPVPTESEATVSSPCSDITPANEKESSQGRLSPFLLPRVAGQMMGDVYELFQQWSVYYGEAATEPVVRLFQPILLRMQQESERIPSSS